MYVEIVCYQKINNSLTNGVLLHHIICTGASGTSQERNHLKRTEPNGFPTIAPAATTAKWMYKEHLFGKCACL
jgi:hypothetical protein